MNTPNIVYIQVSGITASGKSAISQVISEALRERGISVEIIDQDGPLSLERREEDLERIFESLEKRGTKVLLNQVQLRLPPKYD